MKALIISLLLIIIGGFLITKHYYVIGGLVWVIALIYAKVIDRKKNNKNLPI